MSDNISEKEINKKDKSNNKKKPIVIIVVIILLVLIILGIGCYIAYDRGLIFAKSDETTKIRSESSNKKLDTDMDDDGDFLLDDLESDDDVLDTGDDSDVDDKNDECEENCSLLDFDASKCINEDGVKYTLRAEGSGFYAALSEDKKTLNLNVNWKTINNRYSIDKSSGGSEEFKINFSQEVEDIFVGGFGQSVSGDTIFFLMTDGSVEYIPVYKAATSKKFDSYGKLKGVSDVVKFYSVSANAGQTGNGITTLARKSDGSFYDLASILQATGNY